MPRDPETIFRDLIARDLRLSQSQCSFQPLLTVLQGHLRDDQVLVIASISAPSIIELGKTQPSWPLVCTSREIQEPDVPPLTGKLSVLSPQVPIALLTAPGSINRTVARILRPCFIDTADKGWIRKTLQRLDPSTRRVSTSWATKCGSNLSDLYRNDASCNRDHGHKHLPHLISSNKHFRHSFNYYFSSLAKDLQ